MDFPKVQFIQYFVQPGKSGDTVYDYYYISIKNLEKKKHVSHTIYIIYYFYYYLNLLSEQFFKSLNFN